MDEPFSALDFQSRLNISNDVYNILKNENKTMILVTHDISEAITLCSKVIVLSIRPSHIKQIYNITYDQELSPIERRNSHLFNEYYNLIWKEIDHE